MVATWRDRHMKILVVDDHVLIREALHGVLKELRPDATILEASDCRHAIQIAGEHVNLALVLLDLSLPDGDGFALLTELRARHPAATVVVLSAHKDRSSVTRALDLGALGFIPKSARRPVMLGALQLVLAGGIYVPPEIFDPTEAPPSLAQQPTAAPISPSDLGLTERQVEVVALMMQGKSNKAICRELDIAEATVKNHITSILKALKVANRTEAVIAIGKLGWKLPR
jgi:DNA-binding NarL/FixJ family response regulator